MSPELFKLFIHDLSIALEAIDELDLPQLNGFKVIHLLWADDLVLLALDPGSLKKLLDCLCEYADTGANPLTQAKETSWCSTLAHVF